MDTLIGETKFDELEGKQEDTKVVSLSKMATNLPSVSISLNSIIWDTSCDKDAYCICEQWISRPVCASTQANQDRHILPESNPKSVIQNCSRRYSIILKMYFSDVNKTWYFLWMILLDDSHEM